MSRLTRRANLKPRSRSYAEWVTQAAVLAASTATWTQNLPIGSPFRTTVAAGTGAMVGTPESTTAGVRFGANKMLARVIQHCFPDATTFNENASTGRVVVAYTTFTPYQTQTFISRSRNGYTSGSATAEDEGQVVTDFIYWDAVLGKTMRRNPSVGGAPSEYVWP